RRAVGPKADLLSRSKTVHIFPPGRAFSLAFLIEDPNFCIPRRCTCPGEFPASGNRLVLGEMAEVSDVRLDGNAFAKVFGGGLKGAEVLSGTGTSDDPKEGS